MNENINKRIKSFSSLLLELVKAGILIVGIIVLVFLLLGDGSGPYVKSVINNIGELITIVTSETIIGIALLVIAWFVITRMKK